MSGISSGRKKSPIAQAAHERGFGEATLGNWVNKFRREHAGEEAPPVGE